MKEVSNSYSRKHFLQITSTSLTYWLVGGFAFGASGILQSCSKNEMMNMHDGEMMMGVPVTVIEGSFENLLPLIQSFNVVSTLSPQTTSAIIDNRNFQVLGYTETAMLGPAFNYFNGENVAISISNLLNETTNVHWHGLHIASQVDGLPNQAIVAGTSFLASFQINQRAAMCWYHPHFDGKTASQVWKGLAGLFFIRDAEESALNLPTGEFEIPLVIQDRNLSGNSFSYNPSQMDIMFGLQGECILVNGQYSPFTSVSRSCYRLRVLNGSNARIYNLGFHDNRPFRIIGNDGGLLPQSVDVTSAFLAPGERLDILFDLTNAVEGEIIYLQNKFFNGTGSTQGSQEYAILKFAVNSSSGINNSIGQTTSNITPLQLAGGNSRSFDISNQSMSMQMKHNINGVEFNSSIVNFNVPSNTTEMWVFDNSNGMESHPMHVHGTSFQIIERTGGRASVMPYESGWKDTVLVMAGEKVKVLIAFNVPVGNYVLHCHNLEHEDNGMMLQFSVS